MDKKIVYVITDAWKGNVLGVFDDKDKIIDYLINNEDYIDNKSELIFDFIIEDFLDYAEENDLTVPEDYEEAQEWIEDSENFDTFLTFFRKKIEEDLYYVDNYNIEICSFYLNET
jgi:hypothetical protein